MAHRVSKEGVQPSNSSLKAIAECALPQIYTEVHAFLGLVGHYQRFIKGFAHIAQPLNDQLTGEGASRKSEHVLLSEDALMALKVPKQACMTAPVFAFTNYTKPFLLETCIQGWARGSADPETGRQMLSPSCLWEQSPYVS